MSALIRFPHGLLRRYLSVFERLLVASALAGLLYQLMNGIPAYPRYWDAVITGVVFGITLWSPALGYFLAVAAAAYPLYYLSIYILVLFLAVALIGQRLFIHNLGATLLVLAAPWLSPIYLSWGIPIIGGIWWGSAGGAAMGACAAFWGQLVAGMAGMNPDWLMRIGVAPDTGAIAARFSGLNSLETLKLIIAPLAPDSTTLLYYLLQILLWATVGGLIGYSADRSWAQGRLPWSTILLGWLGAFAMLLGQIFLALWLGQHTLEDLALIWQPLLFSTLTSALMVSTLESLRDLVEHPLPPPRSRRQRYRDRHLAALAPSPGSLPTTVQVSKKEDDKDKDDLIMIELD